MCSIGSVAFKFVALLGVGISCLAGGEVAEQTTTVSKTPPIFGAELPGSWEFTLQSSFQFLPMATPVFWFAGRVERNPIRYKLATQVLSARCLPTKIWGSGILRGRLEVSANLIGSIIVAGPENYFVGVAPGLRYYFIQPGARLLPYIELSGGPGLTNSSGIRYGQQQDFENVLPVAVE